MVWVWEVHDAGCTSAGDSEGAAPGADFGDCVDGGGFGQADVGEAAWVGWDWEWDWEWEREWERIGFCFESDFFRQCSGK